MFPQNESNGASKLHELQKKVELLERRLAQLEAIINSGAPDTAQLSRVPGVVKSKPSNAQLTTTPFSLRPVENSARIEAGISTELEIRDKNLIQLLNEEIGKYPGVNFGGDLVVMTNPFPAIVRQTL
jgi:hypothetical protein